MVLSNEQYDDILTQLEAHRGEKLRGRLFDLAIKKRAVAECAQGDMTIEDLSITIDGYDDTIRKDKELRSDGGYHETHSASRHRSEDHRAPALNRIIALEVAADPAIVAFRADHLGAGLLIISQVDTWIRQTADNDDSPTELITLPIESLGDMVSSGVLAIDDRSDFKRDTPLLRYVADQARAARSTLVQVDGVLGRLATISWRIARWYGWEEAATTTYILTGLIPPPRGASVRGIEPWPFPVARRRIQLDIPLSYTPAEVGDIYRQQRDEMLDDDRHPRKSLKKQTADLAVFVAKHSPTLTRKRAEEIWNRENSKTPERQYHDFARFNRACNTAYASVVGKELIWTQEN